MIASGALSRQIENAKYPASGNPPGENAKNGFNTKTRGARRGRRGPRGCPARPSILPFLVFFVDLCVLCVPSDFRVFALSRFRVLKQSVQPPAHGRGPL